VRFTPVDITERMEHVLDAIRVMLHAPLPDPLPLGEMGFIRAGPGRGFAGGRRFRRRRPTGRGP
jgi:hypothetical protein